MTFRAARLTAVFVLIATLSASAVQAPAAGALPSIGVLADAPSADARIPFRQGLGERGWVVGRNVQLAYRYARGRAHRYPELATELVRLGSDVILADGAPAVAAARGASATVPIVMTLIGDPVAAGLVASLARPGGNVTGVSTFAPGANTHRLELIARIVPDLSTLAILWDPENRAMVSDMGAIQAAARARRLRLVLLDVPGPRGEETIFTEMERAGAQALLVLEPVGPLHQKRIARAALRRKVPTFWTRGELLELGGVLAYGAATADLFRRAAGVVDRILRGARPDALPVEQVPRSALTLNLATARALDLAIPRDVYTQADRVVR